MEAMASVWRRLRQVDPPVCRCDLGPEIEMGRWGRNMAARTKLVASNWKMNGLRKDGAALARGLAQRAIATGSDAPHCDLLICPPTSLLATVGGVLAGSGIALGAQDCH